MHGAGRITSKLLNVYSLLVVNFILSFVVCSQVCAVEQGPKFMHCTRADIAKNGPFDTRLLRGVRGLYEKRRCIANNLPPGPERNAQLGCLTGLDENGCMQGSKAVCDACDRALPGIPNKSLINYTWQGLIPGELQFKSDEFPDGLNMVELSMICLFCPISYMTMLCGCATLNTTTLVFVSR